MGEIFLNSLLWIYHTLAFENLGVAIIEISILSRVVLFPFLRQQTTYGKKMSQLTPHINALKEKHKDDKQAYAQAQMALFKEHGVNPAAGCLPAVVQIALLFGLLGALNKLLVMKLNTHFLFWDMAQPDTFAISGIPFAIPGTLVILAAATQYVQTKLMMPTPPPVHKEDKPKEKEEKTGFMEEFAKSQASMMWMFPLMFLFIGTRWPSGLALYWTTSSLLVVAQQWWMQGKMNWKQLLP